MYIQRLEPGTCIRGRGAHQNRSDLERTWEHYQQEHVRGSLPGEPSSSPHMSTAILSGTGKIAEVRVWSGHVHEPEHCLAHSWNVGTPWASMIRNKTWRAEAWGRLNPEQRKMGQTTGFPVGDLALVPCGHPTYFIFLVGSLNIHHTFSCITSQISPSSRLIVRYLASHFIKKRETIRRQLPHASIMTPKCRPPFIPPLYFIFYFIFSNRSLSLVP